MDSSNRNIPNRATAQNALEAAQLAALETEKRRARAMVCAWGSVTAMALVAAIGLATGCANHDIEGSVLRVIPGCKGAAHHDEPEEFARLATAFLKNELG